MPLRTSIRCLSLRAYAAASFFLLFFSSISLSIIFNMQRGTLEVHTTTYSITCLTFLGSNQLSAQGFTTKNSDTSSKAIATPTWSVITGKQGAIGPRINS